MTQEKYFAELRATSLNPLNSVPLDALSTERSYLTKLCSKLAVSYVCRDCRFFGRNDLWIKSALKRADKRSLFYIQK